MVFVSNVRIAMDSPPLSDFKSESVRLFLDFPLPCDVICERSLKILYREFIMLLLGIESVHSWNLYVKEIK